MVSSINMQAPDTTFEFVDDTDLLTILEDYYLQTQKAAAGDSYLGVIVGCGSVVEGLLTWALLQRGHEALSCGKAPKDNQGAGLARPWLADFGMRALVRLASEEETGIGVSDVERHKIRDCYEPVPDCTPPAQEQLDRVIAFIKGAIERGQPVAVSCGAGCGRTGTVLCCYLVADGLDPQDAIAKLVAARPCSREMLRVPGQKDAVLEFHRRMITMD